MYLADLTQNELATYLAIRLPIADCRLRISDDYLVRNTCTCAGAQLRSNVRNPQFAILAYGGFWLMTDEAHIATIASHPEWRGCGLGLYLMLALLDVAQASGRTPL